MMFSIKDFLKKSLMKNFIFCAVIVNTTLLQCKELLIALNMSEKAEAATGRVI